MNNDEQQKRVLAFAIVVGVLVGAAFSHFLLFPFIVLVFIGDLVYACVGKLIYYAVLIISFLLSAMICEFISYLIGKKF